MMGCDNVNEQEKSNEFTKSENKAIVATYWVISFYLLFLCFFVAFKSVLENVGMHILYIFSGLYIGMAVSLVLYLILLFSKLLRINKFRLKYGVIAGLLSVAFSLFSPIGIDYIADIFTDTKIITTDEYVIPFKEDIYIKFLDDNGDKISIPVSDEIANKLKHNPVLDKWSRNSFQYHENTITIEYYPNSHVLLGVKINRE